MTSLMNPLGNSGRIGRSIKRIVRISLVVGRDSRLKKPPGNLPAGVSFLAIVAGQRKKIDPGPRVRRHHRHHHHRFTVGHHHGARRRFASQPDSNVSVLPPILHSEVYFFITVTLFRFRHNVLVCCVRLPTRQPSLPMRPIRHPQLHDDTQSSKIFTKKGWVARTQLTLAMSQDFPSDNPSHQSNTTAEWPPYSNATL